MADYGLLVKNNANEIQIDSLYKNFSLFGSGSLAISSGENTINFTDTAQTPIIGIRPTTTTFCVLKKLNKSGANYITATIEGQLDVSGTIQWLVFIDGLLNALPTYGLIVKNSSNEVVFSSNESYFKIKGIYSPSVSTGSYVNVTVNNADNNYFILYPYSYYIESEWVEEIQAYGTTVFCMGIKKISSTVVRVGSFDVWTGETLSDETDSDWYSSCKLIEVGT